MVETSEKAKKVSLESLGMLLIGFGVWLLAGYGKENIILGIGGSVIIIAGVALLLIREFVVKKDIVFDLGIGEIDDETKKEIVEIAKAYLEKKKIGKDDAIGEGENLSSEMEIHDKIKEDTEKFDHEESKSEINEEEMKKKLKEELDKMELPKNPEPIKEEIKPEIKTEEKKEEKKPIKKIKKE